MNLLSMILLIASVLYQIPKYTNNYMKNVVNYIIECMNFCTTEKTET